MTKSEFISEVEKRFQQKMEKAFNFKYAKSVFVIRGIENKNEYYFYIKESKIDKPFWGFTDVIIDGLEETNCPYFLILLSAENNYCFSNDLVLNFCKNLSYSETGEEKGEFKLTPSYLVNYDHCKLNLDNLLEQARNTSEVINKKEIDKEYIAEFFPNLIKSNKKPEKLEIIKDKCQVIADIVNNLCKVQKSYSETAKSFLETTIGASIFYLYNLKTDDWCNGKVIVSENAYEEYEFCPDHIVPRKSASAILLEKGLKKDLTNDEVYELLDKIFCRVVYLTKGENASYKNKVITDLDNLFSFETLSKMYKDQKNIILKAISKEEFEIIKR